MTAHSFSRFLEPAAWATAATALAMFAVMRWTGTTQEAFEVVRALPGYVAEMRAREASLRLLLAVDVCFIASFTVFFIAWASRQSEQGASPLAVGIGLGRMLLVTALDLLEDSHLLVLLREATEGDGSGVLASSVRWQMAESNLKFALSFVGIAVLALSWPNRTATATAIRAMLLLQVAFGAALLTATDAWKPMIGGIFGLFFIAGPLLVVYAERAILRPLP